MKQTLRNFFFFFLLGAIGANAQPIITSSMVPQVGDQFNIQYILSSSVGAPGSGGANVTWDYSKAQDSSAGGILTFFPPSTLPGYSNFPNAQSATIDLSDTTITYYTGNSSSYGFVGQFQVSDSSLTSFTPQFTKLAFPFTYPQTYVDTFTYFSPVISTNTVYGFDSLVADGYGTLITPSGTFNNVLRVRQVVTLIVVFSGINIPIATETYYDYYYSGVHYPIFEFSSNNGAGWIANYYKTNPLPLRISGFIATLQNEKPYLQWQATNTTNTKGFNVQRSLDGQTFTNVGWVAAKNTEPAYHFADSYTLTGKVYYRLQQEDKDGEVYYSNVASLNAGVENVFAAYPNPTKTNVHFSVPVGSSCQIAVYSYAGKLVYENKNYTASESIPTDAWGKGTYIATIKTNNGIKVTSFIKQ